MFDSLQAVECARYEIITAICWRFESPWTSLPFDWQIVRNCSPIDTA